MNLKWDNKQSGIYSITNKKNNKIYIGKSINLYRRKYQHFGELKRNDHKNKHLQASFNKHGFENFEFNVVEICEVDILGIREYYWINFFDSCNRKKGYNIELINENGLNVRSIESIKSMRKTLKKIKIDKPKGKGNPTSKQVYQYDLNGNFISEFESCHLAAEFLNKKESFTTISKVARKMYGTSCGYQWRYFKCDNIGISEISEKMDKIREDNNKKLSIPINGVKIDTGEIIEFSSINEASKKLGISISNISKIVLGERKSSRKLNMFFYRKS